LPSFLGDGPRNEDSCGAAKGISGSCGVLMVGVLVVAREGVMFWILEVTVGPAVRSVGA
jgi:hypothetical protein